MKQGRLLAVALILALGWQPSGAAQGPMVAADSVTLDLAQTEAGIDVVHTVDVQVSDAAFDGNVSIYVPFAAVIQDLTVTNGATAASMWPDNAALVQAANTAGESQLRFNLWDSGLTNETGRYTIVIAYAVQGALTFTGRVAMDTGILLVFARPLDGFEVRGVGLSGFALVGDGRVHASIPAVMADTAYAVAFQPELPPLLDFTAYAWGAAGVAVGLFAMYVMVKQGWFTIRRGKKFEKGGALESRDMLEARRRTLMAALKELETSHDAGEVPDSAYAPLKEEYKAQAVRAMRNLEAKKE